MVKKRICAIHQPNFFPWLGYFEKIERSDVFVLLNAVDYEKSGHSMQCYTNRVSILKNGKAFYIHCPVVREHGIQSICDVKINNNIDWRDRLKQEIKADYEKTKYYSDIKEFIFSLIDYETDFISEFNINIIGELAKKLDLSAKLVRQDQFNTRGHSTELLAELVKAVQCECYLYGGGGLKYQKNEIFEEQGIIPIAQNFQFPYYKQITEPFVPGLSILDTLFHCGFEETKKLLHIK